VIDRNEGPKLQSLITDHISDCQLLGPLPPPMVRLTCLTLTPCACILVLVRFPFCSQYTYIFITIQVTCYRYKLQTTDAATSRPPLPETSDASGIHNYFTLQPLLHSLQFRSQIRSDLTVVHAIPTRATTITLTAKTSKSPNHRKLEYQ